MTYHLLIYRYRNKLRPLYTKSSPTNCRRIVDLLDQVLKLFARLRQFFCFLINVYQQMALSKRPCHYFFFLLIINICFFITCFFTFSRYPQGVTGSLPLMSYLHHHHEDDQLDYNNTPYFWSKS